jgi:hypothetical protein
MLKGRNRRFSLIAAPIAVLATLSFAPSASAIVYCVPNDTVNPSCDTAQGQPTVQAALAAAQASAAADTIRIGTGTFDVPIDQTYNGTTGGTLQIAGAGRSLTTWRAANSAGSTHAFELQNGTGSSISDLTMLLLDDADSTSDYGLQLTTGGTPAVSRLDIDGPAVSNTAGLQTSVPATIDHSTVTLQQPAPSTNQGIVSSSTNAVVTDSTISSEIALSHGGSPANTLTVRRSTLHTMFWGFKSDSGNLDMSDSVIDLMGSPGAEGVIPSNSNLGLSPITATLDGVTIVNGGANSKGIEATADSEQVAGNGTTQAEKDDMVDDGENVTVTVRNTVISGVVTPIEIGADRGQTATVTTSYSNYASANNTVNPNISGADATGTATLNQTNQTNLAPGFVNAGVGDYHLLASSPLLDIGDPAAPAPGVRDIDGDSRGLSKTSSCTAPDPGRRDIGADEFVASPLPAASCALPMTPGPAKTTCKKKKKTRKPHQLRRCKKKKKKGRR